MSNVITMNERSSAKRLAPADLSLLSPVLAGILTGVGYYVGAKVGFALTFQPHPVSTLWPPNSILLAALLLTPTRWWWLLILAVLPAHLLVELRTGVPTPMVLSWFVSNSSEALIGAFCIRRFSDRPLRFDTIHQVLVFGFAALVAPFLSSFLDAGFVILNQFGSGYWQIWRMRFFANVLAEVTLVPVIVMWGTIGISSFRNLSRWRWFETIALATAVLAVSLGAFGWFLGNLTTTPALLYAPVPILLWAAVRFGPRAVNTSLAVVAFLAIWNTIHSRGPFSAHSAEESALAIQLFLILISMPLMFLAAVMQEHARAQREVLQNEDRLTMALNAAQMGTWDWRIRDSVTKWSDQTKRMFGLSPDDQELPPEVFYELIHPDDRLAVEQAINRSIKEGVTYEAEFRLPQSDGTLRWIRGKGKVMFDEAGNPSHMVGVNADITRHKNAQERLQRSNRRVRALAGRLISAQEVERRRISHELHDDLNQQVATMAIAISRLKHKTPETETEVIDQLNHLYGQTDELSNHIRQLSHQLHPATLEHLSLSDALAGYINEFQDQHGMQIDFRSDLRTRDIPFEISICVYRIVLEALRNSNRHSGAKSASVLLNEDEHYLILEVADSGVGFDIEASKRSSGLGLISAEERVHLLQGNFELISSPGNGTKLIARIPLNHNESS